MLVFLNRRFMLYIRQFSVKKKNGRYSLNNGFNFSCNEFRIYIILYCSVKLALEKSRIIRADFIWQKRVSSVDTSHDFWTQWSTGDERPTLGGIRITLGLLLVE